MQLSGRDLAILRHLVQGSTNRQIGHDLGAPQAVVKKQLTLLFQKIGVESRLQAKEWARANGINEC